MNSFDLDGCEKEKEHCRSILACLVEGVVIVDPNGTILDMNPTALRLHEFEHFQNVIKEISEYPTVFDLYDLEDNVLPFEKWPLSKAVNGEAFSNIEVKVHRRDTGTMWIGNCNGTPVKDKEGNFVLSIVTIQDVTSKKLAETSLRQYENYLSSIIESIEDGILAVDHNGMTIIANNLFAKLWKIPKTIVATKENPGDAVLVAAAKELTDPDSFIEKIRRLHDSQEMDKDEISFKDGRIYECFTSPILPVDTVHGRIWSFRDITKRVQSEKALLDYKEHLRLALLVSNQGLYEFDIPAGRANVNDEYITMLEYAPGEIKQITLNWWTNTIHPEDRERARSIMDNCIFGKSDYYKMVFRMQTKSGGWKWILCQGKNTEYDKQGRPVRMLGTHIDITDRKELEQKLVEHTRFIESIINLTPDILYIHDLIESKSIFVSNSIEKMLGYSKEEIRAMENRVISTLMHPDDFVRYEQTILPQYAHIKNNVPIIHEYRMKHKSGQWRWLALNETIYLRQSDGTPSQIFGLAHDITESKYTEEALRESEYFFKESQHACNIGSYKLDFTTGYWISSEVLDQIFGIDSNYSKNSKGWLDIVHPDDRTMMKEFLDVEVIGKCHSFKKEYRIIRKTDHVLRWVYVQGDCFTDKQGKPFSILGTIQDITERKQYEFALIDEKNRLAKIAAVLPGVIFSYYPLPDGSARLPYASPALFSVIGFKPEEVADDMSPFFTSIHPDDFKSVQESIVKAIHDQSPWHKEFRYNHPFKGEIWLEGNSEPAREANGVLLWHGFFIDVTERKRAEIALREERNKLTRIAATVPGVIIAFRMGADGSTQTPYASPAYLNVMGFRPEDVAKDMSFVFALVHPDDIEQLNKSIIESARTLTPWHAEFRYKHPQKGEIWIEGHTVPQREADSSTIWYGFVTDITERKHAEEVRNRLTRELLALSSCNQALIRAENEQSLLNEICRIVCEKADYSIAWVGSINNNGTPNKKVAVSAGFGESVKTGETYTLNDDGETPIDIAILHKKSSITPDFANGPARSLWSDYALKCNCLSGIALPLLDDRKNPLGVLSIYSKQRNVFAPEEVKLLEELAGDLSFGIMNLRTRVERRLAQNALVYEKELSDALIEASPGIFCVLDQNSRFLRINSNSMILKGLTRENSAMHNPFEMVYKEDYEKAKQHLAQLPHVGYIQDDIRFEFKPGEISWWSMSGHAVTIAGALYLIISGFEITSRKQMEHNLQTALKEKEVLLQELYHRTKNNMQVISSYLAMQAFSLNDENLQIIFNEMENRIRAMALVHEKLYKSKDLTNINLQNYLIDLTRLIFNSFPDVSDKVTLTFEIEEVSLTMDVAIPVGLVVTELLTNSLKYAFPEDRSGNIHLRVRKLDTCKLELDIIDNGVGVPDGFDFTHKSSIGIPTVLSIVQKQLRGSVEFDTSTGFSSKIIFRSDMYSRRV